MYIDVARCVCISVARCVFISVARCVCISVARCVFISVARCVYIDVARCVFISVARCVCISVVKCCASVLSTTKCICLCSHIRCVCVCVCVCVCAHQHVCLCVRENMCVCIWCMCSLYAPAASQHSPVLQESLLVRITHPPPLHHHCTPSVYFLITVMTINIKYSQGGSLPGTRLDLLTRGPKPGPASWLGMQVTQWVPSGACLPESPPNDLTSHAWLGHRDSQLVTSVTHGSSPQPTGRGWQNHSSEGFSPWPPISQLGTF